MNKEIKIDDIDINSIIIEDIDTKDFPDFCDAFISYAEFKDGTPLTDIELDFINDFECSIINELIHEKQLYL